MITTTQTTMGSPLVTRTESTRSGIYWAIAVAALVLIAIALTMRTSTSVSTAPVNTITAETLATRSATPQSSATTTNTMTTPRPSQMTDNRAAANIDNRPESAGPQGSNLDKPISTGATPAATR